MGEAKIKRNSALARVGDETMVAQTLGGRMHVRWDETTQATPHGQLVFFAEFLATAGVFDRWVDDCPLRYSSPNASSNRDVLGTLMLGILAGSRRYAHIAGVRGDAVAAQALGLRRVVSEDSVRRALKAIPGEAGDAWMRGALLDSVRGALDQPWVLDLDTTIKTLYGRQEGAEISFNPHKHGRPSHALHTFWVGNLRLVLDAVLASGKQHTSAHAAAPLERLLDELGEQRPALVRGDCGYGNERIIAVCEARGLPYLLRLRQTVNVKRLIERTFGRRDWTRATAMSQGWQAIEDSLQLQGWSKTRRVVVMRRRLRDDLVLTRSRRGADGREKQLVLALAVDQVLDGTKMWEYTVLVTDADYDLRLLAAVGRAVNHAGRTTLYLTPMHAEVGLIKSMIVNVRAAVGHVQRAAEQLPALDRWRLLLAYICQRIVRQTVFPTPPPGLDRPVNCRI